MNKKKSIYILSILNAIYLIYLICRPYKYPVLGIALISIIIILLDIYLTHKWLKAVKKDKLYSNKKKLILYTGFSTLFLILYFCVCGGVKFFTNTYQDAKIVFSKEDISQSFITSITIDNEVFNNSNNKFYDDLGTENTKIKFKLEENNATLTIEDARSGIITLNKTSDGMKVKDGENNRTIKLEDNEAIEYEIGSLSVFDGKSVIRSVISLELILFVTFMIASYLMNINNKNNKNKKNIIIAMLIVVLIGLYYYQTTRIGNLHPDSHGYINYNFQDLLKLKLNDRTPVYPLIIRIIRLCFGINNYLRIISFFQYIVWFISMIYLYKLLEILIKNKKLVFLSTILYSLMTSIVGWNNVILTESLALSGTVIYIYYVIKYIKENKLSSIMKAIVLSLILTFHRPTAIILVFFLPIFWIVRFIFEREHIRNDIKGFIGSMLSVIVIVIYAILFHRTYNIYSITSAMVRQNLYVNMYSGFYKNSNDEQFIYRVEQAIANNPNNKWQGLGEVKSQYSNEELVRINRQCKLNNIKGYLRYLVNLTVSNMPVEFSSYSFTTINSSVNIINQFISSSINIITFASVYLAIIIEFIIFIYKWIKDKKIPWLDGGLFAFPLVIVASTFIGTNAEFMRTAICAVPFTFITYILLISRIIKE